ncbi:MAG: hypothetical protein H7Z42_04190 [Roseiflexaceae bacterium]|nr:hypothetical protein [Roseiflexaceae bacterium]
MEATAQRSQRLETVVAILIAVATVLGALIAWRSSIAEDGAGDADFAGLRASVSAEETRALNYVNAYENFGAYANYKRYQELGNLVEEDQASASEEEALVLERERADSQDLSISSQRLFPNKFLDRDGSYNVNRQLGEMWADAAKENNLNPDPQFAEAEQLRGKSTSLLVAATVLAIALVFYTLVEAFGARMQYVMAALGSLCLVAGTVFALLIEFRP